MAFEKYIDLTLLWHTINVNMTVEINETKRGKVSLIKQVNERCKPITIIRIQSKRNKKKNVHSKKRHPVSVQNVRNREKEITFLLLV